ncbi:MAG: D-ribose pyranase [Synergistales bacterium]|jgi:D-ribose pyranase|nr:D-ribose pyranase [Synergistales bacterium]
MKKGGLLHPELNFYISLLGHTDRFCVADAGLPIPENVPRVDLAYMPGRPCFWDVLEALLGETVVERAFCAEETSTEIREGLKKRLGRECELVAVPHEKLKEMTGSVSFVVRTGECTPFANVILQSGVFF